MKRQPVITTIILLVVLGMMLMPGTVSGTTCTATESSHVVQAGQNLFRISLQYGVSMQSIAARNGISNLHLIYVGDVLCIPSGTSQSTSSTSTQNSTEVDVSSLVSGIPTLYISGDEYNWCSDPTIWGDGRCDVADTDLQAYYYQLGWYLPRVADGLFTLQDAAFLYTGMIPAAPTAKNTGPKTTN